MVRRIWRKKDSWYTDGRKQYGESLSKTQKYDGFGIGYLESQHLGDEGKSIRNSRSVSVTQQV